MTVTSISSVLNVMGTACADMWLDGFISFL